MKSILAMVVLSVVSFTAVEVRADCQERMCSMYRDSNDSALRSFLGTLALNPNPPVGVDLFAWAFNDYWDRLQAIAARYRRDLRECQTNPNLYADYPIRPDCAGPNTHIASVGEEALPLS